MADQNEAQRDSSMNKNNYGRGQEAQYAAASPDNGDEEPATPQAQQEPMTVYFEDMHGFRLTFRLKPTTTMGKAMRFFSEKAECDLHELRFLFEGIRIINDHTPLSVSAPSLPVSVCY